MEDDDIRRYSLAALSEMRSRGTTVTRVDAPAYEIDDAFWDAAYVVHSPGSRAAVELPIDVEVLEWFRAQGPDHLARMSAVLRAFKEGRILPRAG